MTAQADDARRRAASLSAQEVVDGLEAASGCRRQVGEGTRYWTGLPDGLRVRMEKRASAGLGIDGGSSEVLLDAASATAGLGLLSAMALSGLATYEVVRHHSAMPFVVLAAITAALAVGGVALRIRVARRVRDDPLALTAMERGVVRGYVVAPPALLVASERTEEVQLVALAGMQTDLIKRSEVWGHPIVGARPRGVDLDRMVVDIYEHGFRLHEARLASSAAVGRDAARTASLDELARAALAALAEEVGALCAYADAVRRLEEVVDAESRVRAPEGLPASRLANDLVEVVPVSDFYAEELRAGVRALNASEAELSARLDATSAL